MAAYRLQRAEARSQHLQEQQQQQQPKQQWPPPERSRKPAAEERRRASEQQNSLSRTQSGEWDSSAMLFESLDAAAMRKRLEEERAERARNEKLAAERVQAANQELEKAHQQNAIDRLTDFQIEEFKEVRVRVVCTHPLSSLVNHMSHVHVHVPVPALSLHCPCRHGCCYWHRPHSDPTRACVRTDATRPTHPHAPWLHGEQAFNVYDIDGSGSIEADELRKLMQSVGQTPTDDELNHMITVADADGSGEVDFYEFVALMAHKMANPSNSAPAPVSVLLRRECRGP